MTAFQDASVPPQCRLADGLVSEGQASQSDQSIPGARSGWSECIIASQGGSRADCTGLSPMDGGQTAICRAGAARATPGFELPYRYIFHTACPNPGHSAWQTSLGLISCYESCFSLAAALDCKSLVVPVLGTGRLGVAADRGASTLRRVIVTWLAEHRLPKRVTVATCSDDVARAFRRGLALH